MCRDGRGGGRGVNDKMHKKQIRTYFFETKMKWPLWKDTWVNLQNGLNLFYKPNLLISAGDNSYFPGPIPLWYLPTQTMFTMIPYSLFDISRYSAKICFFSFYSMIYKHTCRYSSLETSSLRSSGSLSGGVKTWLKKYIFVTSFKLLWKLGRLSNRASNITNFFPRFCVYKWASTLFIGIVFKFHMHVQLSK